MGAVERQRDLGRLCWAAEAADHNPAWSPSGSRLAQSLVIYQHLKPDGFAVGRPACPPQTPRTGFAVGRPPPPPTTLRGLYAFPGQPPASPQPPVTRITRVTRTGGSRCPGRPFRPSARDARDVTRPRDVRDRAVPGLGVSWGCLGVSRGTYGALRDGGGRNRAVRPRTYRKPYKVRQVNDRALRPRTYPNANPKFCLVKDCGHPRRHALRRFHSENARYDASLRNLF